jgi:hypothetical protein
MQAVVASGNPKMMVSQKVVTPVKTGVQEFCNSFNILDSGFRRNDQEHCLLTFYEFIKDSYCNLELTGN